MAAELRKALPIADGFLARLRALSPPKGDEPTVRAYLDIVRQQKERMPPLIEALEAEDISSVEVLAEELREGNRRARRLAERYGFTQCAPQGVLGR